MYNTIQYTSDTGKKTRNEKEEEKNIYITTHTHTHSQTAQHIFNLAIYWKCNTEYAPAGSYAKCAAFTASSESAQFALGLALIDR